MNVIEKLENMNMYQLQKICEKVNIPCPKNKRNAIQKLLKPLKMKYKMKDILKPQLKQAYRHYQRVQLPPYLQQKLLEDSIKTNEQILQKLKEYRKQKEQKEQKKLQQEKAVSRGFNKKQKCYKEIQEVNEIIYRIQRNIFLKNPVSKYQNQHQLLKYRTRILKECLQGKKSSNMRP